MFSLFPEFKIIKCEPLTLSFGGFRYSLEELQRPYTAPEIADKAKAVMKSACEPFRDAYGIETVVESPKKNLLSARLYPASAKLRDVVAFDVRKFNSYNKGGLGKGFMNSIEGMCDKMIREKKCTALSPMPDLNGFYVFHELKGELDAEPAADMLEAIGKLMLHPTSNDFAIRREIKPDCLRVDVELYGHKTRDYVC